MPSPKPTNRRSRLVRVSSLVPYANNSRTHSDEQIQAIARSIEEYGFTSPVLTNGKTIVAGHGRVRAAQRLGMLKVPAIDLGGLSQDQIRAYVIADNKLAELAGWDESILKAEFEALKAVDFDLSLTGFTLPEIRTTLNPPEPKNSASVTTRTTIKCPKCGAEIDRKKR